MVTGEEDEYTKFQMRTKLYVMQSDNSWRERGVGVLRLNVRRGDGHGARLGELAIPDCLAPGVIELTQ